jgi:hypothetical protein
MTRPGAAERFVRHAGIGENGHALGRPQHKGENCKTDAIRPVPAITGHTPGREAAIGFDDYCGVTAPLMVWKCRGPFCFSVALVI